jgi:hypothetical protein
VIERVVNGRILRRVKSGPIANSLLAALPREDYRPGNGSGNGNGDSGRRARNGR